MHSYHDRYQVFANAVQQKERLAGTINNVGLSTYASYLEGLYFIGGRKKNSSLRYFQSGAPKERLDSIINKHLMFTNPKLGLFLWLVDSLYLRAISWRDWKKKKKNRIFWRTRANCASRCFQKRCTKRKACRYPKRKGDVSKSKFKTFSMICDIRHLCTLYLVWNILEIPLSRICVLRRTPLNNVIPCDITS